MAFCLTAGLVAVLAAEPAAAQGAAGGAHANREEITERVSLTGLDLTRAADVTRLESRIRAASRRVCDSSGQGTIADSEAQRCRKAARRAGDVKVAELRDRSVRMASAGEEVKLDTVLAISPPDQQ